MRPRDRVAGGHWTEDLFVAHDAIFLRVHEHGWDVGEEQARNLKTVLDRHGVPEGGWILDVPCGIGRHATRLAKMGWEKEALSSDRRKFLLGARAARD